MKKFILFIVLTPLFLHAEDAELKRIIQVYRSDSQFSQELKSNESVYTFKFNGAHTAPPTKVLYSIDGENGKQQLTNGSITIKSTPGKHIFQFFYSQHFYEIYTDSLAIKAQHHDTYQVQLYQAMVEPQMTEKPVIYLYPEEKTVVSVQLAIHGENPFFYPAYGEGWKFTAQPNGDLIFGDKTYNYLFWESAENRNFSEEELKSGFNVKKEEVVAFLEDQLTKAGLSSKEQADFITYWGPRLSANELNFVRFEFNEVCNRYAELEITPKPNHIYRVYMTWMPIEAELDIVPQTIETINREGFCVIEWGGLEINQIPSTSLLLN